MSFFRDSDDTVENNRGFADWWLKRIDRPSDYAQWFVPSDGGTAHWSCAHEPLTRDRIIAHLTGEKQIVGAYFGDKNDLTRMICFDLDQHKTEQNAGDALYRITTTLSHYGVPWLLARSKGGAGYHIWIFLTEKLPMRRVRGFATFILEKSGYDEKKIEINPKQDALEGRQGNLVALPCSAIWQHTTGGSYLLNPDQSVVPSGTEAEFLRYTRETLPAHISVIEESEGVDFDTFGKKAEPPQSQQPHHHASSQPGTDWWTLELLHEFFQRFGFEIDTRQSGEWCKNGYSHRLVLTRCPNAEAHSDQKQVGGAAVFFGAGKGPGFKCLHNSCAGLGWRQMRDKVDPSRTFKCPVPEGLRRSGYHKHNRGVAEKPETFGGYSAILTDRERDFFKTAWCDQDLIEHDIRENRPSKTLHRLQERFGDRVIPKLTKRVCRRMHRVGWCGKFEQHLACREHGAQEVRPGKPCDDQYLCPKCASMMARALAHWIRNEWPKEFIMARVEVPSGGVKEIQEKRREISKKMRGRAGFRWVLGSNHILFVARLDDKEYFEDTLEGVTFEQVDRRSAAKTIINTWLSIPAMIRQLIDSEDEARYVYTVEWITNPSNHRTNANDAANRAFKWIDLEDLRAQKRAKRLEERGGVPEDMCCEPVALPDGSRVPCRQVYSSTLYELFTGTTFGERRGLFNDREVFDRIKAQGLDRLIGEEPKPPSLPAPASSNRTVAPLPHPPPLPLAAPG